MRVRMILRESPARRLLVLQREDLAGERGRSLAAALGQAAGYAAPDYSAAVIRFD